MSDERPPQVESKPFWKSKTFLGLIVTALAPFLAQHLGFTDADTEELVGAVVALLGVGLGVYGRAKATQPLSLGTNPTTGPQVVLWIIFSLASTRYLVACNGTRLVESAELNGTVTRDDRGATTGTGGVRLYFRDGRDSKTIKPVGLRDGAEIRIIPTFPGAQSLVVTAFPEEAR